VLRANPQASPKGHRRQPASAQKAVVDLANPMKNPPVLLVGFGSLRGDGFLFVNDALLFLVFLLFKGKIAANGTNIPRAAIFASYF